jgi:hypothetical protein
MKVAQHVLVEQVGLVEEEDRVNTLAAKIFDVRGDGEEEARGSGGRREPQGEAKLFIRWPLTGRAWCVGLSPLWRGEA